MQVIKRKIIVQSDKNVNGVFTRYVQEHLSTALFGLIPVLRPT